MNKLNIIHTESSCGWGGQEIRILTEIQAFKDAGHKVLLVTPEHAEIYKAAKQRGIDVIAAKIERKNLKGLNAMHKVLTTNHCDIINTHSSTDAWLVALAGLNISNMPPVVRTRHVSTNINNKFVTKWLYTKATDHIVITGEALRQKLIEHNRYLPEHITSIPTGIDLNYYKPHEKNEKREKLGVKNKNTIGILATLRDWKGHDYLLDAFAKLSKTNNEWQVLIIGDGPRRKHLETKIKTLGLEDSVFLVGNQNNVPEWLACLDIFALPSYGEEGVPQSIMQAMACGIPVISTTVGAIREIIVEIGANQTGIIVPPKDTNALKDAMFTLMCDEDIRSKLSSNAVAFANERFGIDKMLSSMERVFYKVLKK